MQLIAYYPFNGNANDESGNGNNGTVDGATLTTDRFGNANKAYSFDGIDDSIQLPVINIGEGTNSSFTISAWSKVELPYGNWNAVIATSDSHYGIGYGIYYNPPIGGGHLNFELSGTGGFTYLNVVKYSDTNYWHHIVLVVDRSGFNKIGYTYFDGQILKDPVYIGNIGNLNGGYNTLIGRVREGGYDPSWMNGLIDDISIYNRALTDSEISSLYTAQSNTAPVP